MLSIESEEVRVDRFCNADGSETPWVRLSLGEHVAYGKEAGTPIENQIIASRNLIRQLINGERDVEFPKFVLFQPVVTRSPNTPRQGRIVRMIWHYKDVCWNYYIESDGKAISKRYLEGDLSNPEEESG